MHQPEKQEEHGEGRSQEAQVIRGRTQVVWGLGQARGFRNREAAGGLGQGSLPGTGVEAQPRCKGGAVSRGRGGDGQVEMRDVNGHAKGRLTEGQAAGKHGVGGGCLLTFDLKRGVVLSMSAAGKSQGPRPRWHLTYL